MANNGNGIKYVPVQTNELCLAAVRQNGMALEYILHQTEDLCFEAVKQNKMALYYVKSFYSTDSIYNEAFTGENNSNINRLSIYIKPNKQETPVKEDDIIKYEKFINDGEITIVDDYLEKSLNANVKVIFEDIVQSKFILLDNNKTQDVKDTIFDHLEKCNGPLQMNFVKGLYYSHKTQDDIMKDNNFAGIYLIKITDELYELHNKVIDKIDKGWMFKNQQDIAKSEKVGKYAKCF